MPDDLGARYEQYLALIDQLVDEELARWPWQNLPVMEKLVRGQVSHKGKRLRPLLMFSLADLLRGDPCRIVSGATGVELYHLASLILDDVQDNSAVRRGLPTVHATSGINTALNTAGLIRALAFQPLHRSSTLTPDEKFRILERVGTAAVQLYLGQSIDIGWNDGWYSTIGDYPYEQMVEWKTGAMFGCASWIAAFVSGMPETVVQRADQIGAKLGALYQLVDDYLDTFGTDGSLLPAALEDLRGGKPTWPVITLHRALVDRGNYKMADLVVEKLRSPDVREADWNWLLQLAVDLQIADTLQRELSSRARELTLQACDLASGSGANSADIESFVQLLLRSATTAILA